MDKQGATKIEEQLKLICNELGIHYNNLKPKTKKHLLNIETAIVRRESKYNELLNELKENKVTLTSISHDTKISRQTLYNNQELRDYINFRALQLDELNPYHQMYELKDKINKLNEKLELMVNRDIDTEILRNQNETLLEQIKNRDNTINRMTKQNTEIERKLIELRRGTVNSNSNKTTTKTKVITLNKSK